MLVRGTRAASWAAIAGALLALMPGEAVGAATGWTRTDVGAITQPAPVSGNFLFYAQHGGSLAVIALNARSGKTAWRAAASPSNVTAGVSATLAVDSGKVFYVAPASGQPGAARVIARNAASGSIVWRSAPGVFVTWPEVCPDERDAICLNGRIGLVQYGELRFAAVDGRLLGAVPIGTPAYPGRELTQDLFDPGTRSPAVLVAASRGRIAWQRPLAEIFTFRNATTDGGWNLDRVARDGIFVGSVGSKPVVRNGKATFHLGVSMTAGFGISDGRARWRSPGLYSCGQPLPCPGRSEFGYSSAAAPSEPSVGIRFVERGIATASRQGVYPTVSRNASVTLQGFDLRTGKTRWSYHAGRNISLIQETGVPPRIDVQTVVIHNGSGRLLALNLATGGTRGVSASTPAWCQKTILYRLSHGGYYGGRSGQYVGQGALYSCTVSGSRTASPAAVPALVGRIGASIGGLTAWTDTGAVHAAPR